jgi:membrane associated rhomboid family serine protease
MGSPPNKISDLADKLTKLGKLRADGALTEDEFKAVKRKLLNTQNAAARQQHQKQTTDPNIDSPLVSTSPSSIDALIAANPAFGANPVVISLIAINVLIFILMWLGNPAFEWNARYLVSWGADYGLLTLNGEIWRLFTSTFVHLNPIHIAGNMSCLFYWGPVTERALGSRVFLLVYCLCGVLASFTSVVIHPEIVSAGASGAIAGVLGIMCVMWFRSDKRVSTEDVLGNLAVNVMISFVGGVDWVAHVGGLISGLVAGSLFFQMHEQTEKT